MAIEFTVGEDYTLVEKPLPAGEYNFVVKEATESQSKSGNPMIRLSLLVTPVDEEHAPVRTVFDQLVFLKTNDMCMRHIHKFCLATGLSESWDEGTLSAEEIEGVTGNLMLKVVVNEWQGVTREINAVAGWIINSDADDNIPF